MSGSNGVIRVGRKGRKKFAFGDDGAPFEVDVVVAYNDWLVIDDRFREASTDRTVATADMPGYYQAALDYVNGLSNGTCDNTAEALDFLARLREQYDECAAFFRPKLRDEPDSQGSSAAELRFSEEPAS